MITIAMAQLKSDYLNKEKNIESAISVLEKSTSKAVDLVIFPELFLTGYEIEDHVAEVAETLEGPSISSLREAAKRYEVGMIIGFPERFGIHLYNSAVCIDKNGNIAGVYRKVHLFEWEKDVFSVGDKACVIEVDGAKISMMMTFDVGFPEMARILALKGAEMIIVLAAHVVPYQVYHKIMMSARALENQVFIAVVNKIGIEKQSVYFGESAIISPHGDYITKVGHSEKLIVETIDLSLVYKVREELSMKYLNNRQVEFFKENGLCK